MAAKGLIVTSVILVFFLGWFYTEADQRRFQSQELDLVMIRNHCQPLSPKLPEPGNRIVRGDIFSKGDTLGLLLNRHEIPTGDIQAICSAVQEILSINKIKIGAKITLYKDQDTEKLLEFRLSNSPNEAVKIIRDEDDQWIAQRMDTLLFTNMERASGTVEGSLWNAAIGKGVPPELILDMADLFGCQVDFTSGLRCGDSFDLFYTNRITKDFGMVPGKITAATFTNAGKQFSAFAFTFPDGKTEYYDQKGNSMRRTFLKAPLEYRRISSGYTRSRFHPILKEYRPHLGIDYAAPKGTPVSALGDGVVVYCGWNGGYGNYVQIKHGDAYETCYGHLDKFAKGIRKGVHVRQSQVVGYVGSTGLATGPHLDFRVKYRGAFINPDSIKSEPAEPIPDELRDLFLQQTTEWQARFQLIQQGEEYVAGKLPEI